MAGLVGWNSEEVELLDSQGAGLLKAWDDFVSGVNSCFRAGYGRSQAAQADVTAYLAEGIAVFLADRRSLNISDPRLERLLAATVFNPAMYR